MKKLYLLLLPFLVSGSQIKVAPVNLSLIRPSNEVDSYYKDIDPNAGSYQLVGQLRDLMFKTHKEFLSYASDLKNPDIYMQTDYDPDNKDSKFIDFYTHTPQDKTWDGKKYNREHVWCTSLSNGIWGRGKTQGADKDYSEKGAGCDIHHVRPSLATANQGRSNDVFTEYPKDQRIERERGGDKYGYTTPNAKGEFFEPYDFVKGDVARIIMYVFIHYSSPEEVGKNLPVPTDEVIGDPNLKLYQKGVEMRTGSLPLYKIIVASPSQANDAKASWETLLKWHKQDPVDQLEINRNNGAAKLQGNRNPFIDHPEYAEKAFSFDASEITKPDNHPPLDSKTIVIIAVSTAVVAITLTTVLLLVYRAKKKRL